MKKIIVRTSIVAAVVTMAVCVIVFCSCSQQNCYVDKIELNGQEISADSIQYSDIMNGGELVFHMTYNEQMDIKPYILAGGVNHGINKD